MKSTGTKCKYSQHQKFFFIENKNKKNSPRFLQFEELTLQAAAAYGRRPRAGDSTTPLYNTLLGKQPAKRRRTAEEAGSQQPGPSTGTRGKNLKF
jgi:hypothetical protein